MGAGLPNAQTYAVEIAAPCDASIETPTYRAVTYPDGFAGGKFKNTWELFENAVKGAKLSQYLGRRPRDADGKLTNKFVYMTYEEVRMQALKLGTQMIESDLAPIISYDDEQYEQAKQMRVMGLFLANSPEWFIMEHGCAAYNIALVPLYETLGKESMAYIINHCQLQSCLVSHATFKSLCEIKGQCESLKNIIITGDKPDQSMIELAKETGLNLFSFNELSLSSEPFTTPTPAQTNKEINTITYTSGTTGKPKGVLTTHENVLSVTHAVENMTFELGINQSTTYLSYLPLAHVFERAVTTICYSNGAKLPCYSGDISKIAEDASIAKPTAFVSVPRLFSRIYDRVLHGIEDKSWVVESIIKYGINSKRAKHKTTAKNTSTTWDIFFSQIRNILGGEVKFMISGGAPLEPEVQETLQVVFSCPLMQGYGMSETFGPCFLQNPQDTVVGQIGGQWPCIETKLLAVPEMNYLTNKPDSLPQGELCLRGPSITPGYFRNPGLNAEAFPDGDGWFRTGDIASITPNHGIRIIDRRKNLFKLAQGEYITPERVENVLSTHHLVNQIIVTGEGTKTFPVAIVIPDEGEFISLCKKLHIEPNDTAYDDEKIKEHIIEALIETGKKLDLKGFEIPKKIHLRKNEFSVEEGFLTPTSKLRRNEIRSAFKDVISELYA